MLLPSAMPCDPSPPRLQTALLASPPASPPQLSTHNALGNIFTTCRSLQSLLATAAPREHQDPFRDDHHMLTPPLSFASVPAPPPMKLRLRPRKPDAAATAATRVVKRAPVAAARGLNKRRRGDDCASDVDESADVTAADKHHHGPDEDKADSAPVASDADADVAASASASTSPSFSSSSTAAAALSIPLPLPLPLPPSSPNRPTTPKRSRIAPELLPLGLERGDYHALEGAGPLPVPGTGTGTGRVRGRGRDADEWTVEDDRILVELVLEKLKLTKSDWHECARSLGKASGGSVSRRWKSLMVSGDVGLRRSTRRSKIHGTWR